MTKRLPDGKRSRSVDVLRFLLSLMIVYFHIFHDNIMASAQEYPIYAELAARCSRSDAVDCFLIISGFFLHRSANRKAPMSFGCFLAERIVRLWPVFAFYTALYFLFYELSGNVAMFDLLFLRGTGISLVNNGIIWYIGPFFWSSLFLYALTTSGRHPKTVNLLLAVLVWFAYSISINTSGGGFSREIAGNFLSLALMRVFGGLGFGYLLAEARERLGKTLLLRYLEQKTPPAAQCVVVSLIEIAASAYIIRFFLFGGGYKNKFAVVIVFSVFWLCMQTGKGVITCLLNRVPVLWRLGKYGYSLYIMQQIGYNLMKRSLWRQGAFLERTALCVTVTILLCYVLAVGTYWLVEHPAVQLYKKLRLRSEASAAAREAEGLGD